MTLDELILVLREERRCLDDAAAAVERLTKAIGTRMDATSAFESACTDPAERVLAREVVESLRTGEWVAEFVH